MEELLEKLADLLEVEKVDVNKKFKDYDEWDSFTALSILSVLDKDYHKQMTYKQLEEYPTIQNFCDEVLS